MPTQKMRLRRLQADTSAGIRRHSQQQCPARPLQRGASKTLRSHKLQRSIMRQACHRQQAYSRQMLHTRL